MNFNQNLFLLATASIFTLPLFSQKALSQECPFDSYMIIAGQCHNMTQEKSSATAYDTINYDPYISNEGDDFTQSWIKECGDFKYQENAQDYLDRYHEYQHLDSDGDGYACDNLIRFDNEILTTAIWRELLHENIQRKQATKNKESLSYYEVVDIIGFHPNASRGSRTIWEDPINNMSIQIIFHKEEIMQMKGIGF